MPLGEPFVLRPPRPPQVIREHGIKVLTVRDILAFGVEEHIGARVDLEDLAKSALTYELAAGMKEGDLEEEDR